MNFEQEVVENKRLRQEIDAKIQEVKNLPASRLLQSCKRL